MSDKKQIVEDVTKVAGATVGVVPGLAEAKGILELIILGEPLVLAGITSLLHKIHGSSNKPAAVKAATAAVDAIPPDPDDIGADPTNVEN